MYKSTTQLYKKCVMYNVSLRIFIQFNISPRVPLFSYILLTFIENIFSKMIHTRII